MSIVKNITSVDNLDWREIVINWEGMGDDVTEIKAGTPMDADGNIANNSNCFGLMMGDVLRTRSRARVVISGPVDLDEAEANSGITLSDEAKAAMRDVWFPGKSGGGLPTGGAPYQQLVTDGEGNTKWEDRLAYETVDEIKYLAETTLNFADKGNGLNGSSITATLDISAGDTVIVTWDGVPYTCIANDTLGVLSFGNMGIAGAGENTGEPFVFVEESSKWMVGTADSSASHVVSVSGYGVIAKKIDAKYLNMSDISSVLKVSISGSERDGFSASHTGEEIRLEYSKGKFVYAEYNGKIFYLTNNPELNDRVSVFRLLNRYGGYNNRFAFEEFSVKADGSVVHKYALSALVMNSSTSGSTKKFMLTVDDSGTISATEV